MTSLIRLYPRAWQARYGAEIDDLVAGRRLGPRESLDLVRGALDAHRHPELVDREMASETPWSPGVSPQRLADLVVARRLGMAAVFGSVAWVSGWLVAANGPMVVDGHDTYRDGSAAAPFILLAMVLLSAGLVGQVIRLPARARVARIAAVVALIASPVWATSPWVLALGIVIVVALAMLAIAAWWVGQWTGVAAVTLLGSIGMGVGSMVLLVLGVQSGVEVPLRGDPMLLVVMSFTPMWIAVAASLFGLPPLDERLAWEAQAQRAFDPA